MSKGISTDAFENFMRKSIENDYINKKNIDALIQKCSEEFSEAGKRMVFIDMWNKAAGEYGTFNESTGYFELNGITDLTYEEAVEIMRVSGTAHIPHIDVNYYGVEARFDFTNCRTIMPITLTTYTPIYMINVGTTQVTSRKTKVIRILNSRPKVISQAFYGLSGLQKVLGTINCSIITSGTIYTGDYCYDIEDIELSEVKTNVDFYRLKNISIESLKFLINKSANTSPITIKVHADVYAKIIDEDNTEWHSLLEMATEKNIQFAKV